MKLMALTDVAIVQLAVAAGVRDFRMNGESIWTKVQQGSLIDDMASVTVKLVGGAEATI